MKIDPSILNVFEAAKCANVIHFPNAIIFERKAAVWTVTLLKDGSEQPCGKNSHGKGKTPEEAYEDMVAMLHERLSKKQSSASREVDEASHLISALKQEGK